MNNMKRQGLFLPLSGRIISKGFIGFDVETYSDKNYFRLGSFVFDEYEITFHNRDDMINYIFNNKRMFQGKYIVATNLQFDLMALFFDHEKYSELNIFWNKSRIISTTIKCADRDKHGDIVFIDTINFNPVSVESLGRIVGLEKMRIDKDVLTKENLSDDEMKYLIEYNINDAMISKKYMEHLQMTLNKLGGNLKLTLPASAMDLYRRQFMKIHFQKERKVLNDNTIEEFILSGYYGGRTEDFFHGVVDDVNYYDVNSEHPFSMLKPFPIPQSVQAVEIPNIRNIINYMGVSECEVSVDNLDIPLLPHRDESSKVIYPIGRFKGVWTHEMLKKAIEIGYKIHSVSRQIIYTEKYPVFQEYISTLYTKRKELKAENNPEEQTVKLLMNSLYGKWGEKPRDSYSVILESSMTPQKMLKLLKTGYEVQISNDKKFFICTKKGDRYPRNCFPILSSYVTSYSNLYLYEFLSKYRPLYCDTDSIMTKEKIPDELIGKELGQLKLEKVGTVEIVAPKFYNFDGEVKIKGLKIRKGEDKVKIFNEFKNGMQIPQEQFVKFKSAVRSIKGLLPNQVITIHKKRLNTTGKRKYMFDGTSIPLILG